MNPDSNTLGALLSEFRRTFSMREVEHGPQRWRYWRGGVDGAYVLWLTGALGVGEFSFAHTLGLAGEFQLLVPDYPPVSVLDALVDGLTALLDAERADTAHVIGGSFGGMVAQHFVRRYPERVSSLVLSHTAAPAPSVIRGAVIRALSVLPEGAYRRLFSRRLRRSFDEADPFWLAYFDSTVARLSKADLVSRVVLADEFLGKAVRREDVATWSGPTLLVDSDDDPLIPPSGQRALRELYPHARTHTFSGMGHSAAILHPEQYVGVIRDFLDACSGTLGSGT